MTNLEFKKIRTGIVSMQKSYLGLTDKVIGVRINGTFYNRAKMNGKLSLKQLQFFEYLPDYEGEPINL